ncbi:glycoside hydrolase family 75 protein [Crocosphaera sp. UHCC 0190]|uniref:glycoside hydrolase family 75 protein n=1 Tax=Crocosphaera sp. UHCC 0190 TaxID=3110246 RepID=UPI002B20BC6D|nr:glycoside hydrolase family 75 protein [Crocosphaera sp. UHCC 0190]MEA5511844.1 glycoside hydrolase family 75 protein [Crocosphaera sp. UHCC 0190]
MIKRLFLWGLIAMPSLLFSSLVLAEKEMTFEEMQFKSTPNDISVWEIANAPQFKTSTSLNCRNGVGISSPIVTVIPANTIVDNRAQKNAMDSNDPYVLNVGSNNNGLWVMVHHNNQQCFVRASMRYMIPWWQNAEARSIHNYKPPSLSEIRLGTIPVAQATPIQESFPPKLNPGLKQILRLPGGQIYIDADMDTDADGSPRARQIDPCEGCGNTETSLKYSGISGQAKNVNAEVVPYIALPGNNPRLQDRFYHRMGIQLGDIVAVIYKDRIEYAIFADVGPKNKIGEGSIALKQSLLGREPINTTNLSVQQVISITNSGISKDVIYIVFPNSKLNGLTPENVVEKVRARGKELFRQIAGNPD